MTEDILFNKSVLESKLFYTAATDKYVKFEMQFVKPVTIHYYSSSGGRQTYTLERSDIGKQLPLPPKTGSLRIRIDENSFKTDIIEIKITIS